MARLLWKVWLAAAGTVVALALAFFGLLDRETLAAPVWIWLDAPAKATNGVLVWPSIGALFALAAGAIGLLFRVERKHEFIAAELKEEIQTLEKKKSALESDIESEKAKFLDSEQRRLTDFITGIPNYHSWLNDLDRWASKTNQRHTLIVVDLENFKQLNEKSRWAANITIREYARLTYKSMRRDEHIYKLPDGPAFTDLGQMYRLYAGGDEFFFIVRGDVFGAIGFMNRHIEDCQRIEDSLRKNELGKFLSPADVSSFKLRFSAILAPIKPGDQPAEVLENALSGIAKAKTDPQSRGLLIAEDRLETPQTVIGALERDLELVETELTRATADHRPHLLDRKERLQRQRNALVRFAEHFALAPLTPPPSDSPRL